MEDWYRVRQKLQLEFEAYERRADWIAAHVEFMRAYSTKDFIPSEFARVMQQMADRPPYPNPYAVLPRNTYPVLLNRIEELDNGLQDVFSAAEAYTSPLIRNLGILSKFWRFEFGRFIVSAVSLFESFLWPDRQQWRYEQFIERRAQYQNLISAFRRDYLTR